MAVTAADSNLSEQALVQEYNDELRNTVLPVTVIFGIEIVLGIVGNSLTLYVFSYHYRPCNFRYFVLCLALTDLISCLTTIPAEMVSQIYWYAYPVPPVCKIKAFFNQFTVCSEAACLTVIAVDRYRKICHPFGWQIGQKTAIKVCICIYFVSSLLAIPTPIFWGVHNQEVEYKNRNITVTVCEKDEKYRDTKLPLANIAFNQSLVLVSLVCMFVLYILVARRLIIGQQEIKRRSLQHKTDSNDSMTDMVNTSSTGDQTDTKISSRLDSGSAIVSDNENKYVAGEESKSSDNKNGKDELTMIVRARRKTMIMFYLTVIFIVTTVMYGALLSIVANGILPSLSGPEKGVYFFFLRLYFINHVVNPVLYGILDPAFRSEMRRLKNKFVKAFCVCSKHSEK